MQMRVQRLQCLEDLRQDVGVNADVQLTFGRIFVRHLPLTVQANAYLASLTRLEFLAVGFHSVGVGKDEVMRDAAEDLGRQQLGINTHPLLAGTHIQCSVLLLCPGAKVPAPYPKTEMHNGSLWVTLTAARE